MQGCLLHIEDDVTIVFISEPALGTYELLILHAENGLNLVVPLTHGVDFPPPPSARSLQLPHDISQVTDLGVPVPVSPEGFNLADRAGEDIP